MNKIIDKLFEIIFYALIVSCFIGAGYGIYQTVTDDIKIWETMVLLAMGIAGSTLITTNHEI